MCQLSSRCDKEITDTFSKKKANKSGGLQLISNNMIKSAKNYILPSLKLLFNKNLICGFYPKIGLRVIILRFLNLAIMMILIDMIAE